MNELSGGTGGRESLSVCVRALFDDKENIDAVLASMPLCNEFGILPEWVPPGAYPLGGDRAGNVDGGEDEEGFRPTAPAAGRSTALGSTSSPGRSSAPGSSSALGSSSAPGSNPPVSPTLSSVLGRKNWSLSLGARR